MTWFELLCVPLGLVAAQAYVRWSERYGSKQLEVLATGLVSAALIYLVAALVRADLFALVLELVGVFVFLVFARLGVRRASGYLALGWTLHVGWDLLAQLAADPVLPRWYAVLCLAFDLVVARAILRAGRHE